MDLKIQKWKCRKISENQDIFDDRNYQNKKCVLAFKKGISGKVKYYHLSQISTFKFRNNLWIQLDQLEIPNARDILIRMTLIYQTI